MNTIPKSPDPRTVSEANVQIRQVIGGDRIDQIAAEYYGNPAYWRVVAEFNNLANPNRLIPGSILRIPKRAMLEEPS